MATTIDRQRRHDEKWQSKVLDGMNRVLAVLHDVSDGVRDLAEAVRALERATQPPPPPTPAGRAEFFSVGDLAELIGLSEGAVRNLRYRGKGPAATKVGGRLRFRRRDVEAWLAGEREAQEAPTRPWKESWLGGGIGSGLARTTDPGPLLLGLAHRTGCGVSLPRHGHLPGVPRRRVGHQERNASQTPAAVSLVT